MESTGVTGRLEPSGFRARASFLDSASLVGGLRLKRLKSGVVILLLLIFGGESIESHRRDDGAWAGPG